MQFILWGRKGRMVQKRNEKKKRKVKNAEKKEN